MTGVLLIGVTLIAGIGVRIAGYSGALMMMLMYLSMLWPENNPFMDEHIIYAVIFIALANVNPGDTWGLGRWWSKTSLVKKFPIFK